MSIDPYVGTYVVIADMHERTDHAIGNQVEVTIKKVGSDYQITSGSQNSIWQSFTGQLHGNSLTGSLSPNLHYTISQVPNMAQIQCSYETKLKETGSWTADDEGTGA